MSNEADKDSKGYIPLTWAIALEAKDVYFADFDLTVADVAERFHVKPWALQNLFAQQGWGMKKLRLRERFLTDIGQQIENESDPAVLRGKYKEILKRLETLDTIDQLSQAVDNSLNYHLQPAVNPDTGNVANPTADTVQKLAPIAIKKIEHELRKLGHNEFSQNNRASAGPSPSDSQPAAEEVSNAMRQLEDEPAGTVEGDQSAGA